MDEKAGKLEEQERNRIKRLESYTSKIIEFGLWQSEEQIKDNLSIFKRKSHKKESLKAQLNFRRYVLQQNAKTEQSDIYSFSKKVSGKTVECTVEELENKVKKLVAHAFTIIVNNDENNLLLFKQKKRL